MPSVSPSTAPRQKISQSGPNPSCAARRVTVAFACASSEQRNALGFGPAPGSRITFDQIDVKPCTTRACFAPAAICSAQLGFPSRPTVSEPLTDTTRPRYGARSAVTSASESAGTTTNTASLAAITSSVASAIPSVFASFIADALPTREPRTKTVWFVRSHSAVATALPISPVPSTAICMAFMGARMEQMATRKKTEAPKRGHREQVTELTDDDDRPLVVSPLPATDRLHNPDDITVDDAAISAGVQHGGTIQTRAETLQVRGTGGRKRSGPRSKGRAGRDISKKR